MAFSIDCNFPGGNIAVDSIEGSTVRLRPDLRDTLTPWFYWYFRVTGAAGRRLTFVFDPKNLGVRGPAVSRDAGVSWKWLGASAVANGEFSYSFPPDANDVRFSMGMPYVRADWDRFLAAHSAKETWQVKELARTPQGREAPLVLAGNPKASLAIVLTARQHCCEMMASYVLEGVLSGLLAKDSAGEWLRERVSFWIVPFMDLDGVENGDQGKNRRPHDHNRDYRDESIYAEVRAVREQLPAWLAGRPFAAFDLHCPALAGAVHESIFFVEPEDRSQARQVDRLSASLRRVQSKDGLFRAPGKLAHGSGFNNLPAADKRTFSAWAGGLPEAVLTATLEIAYANALGAEVNARTARRLGRDFAAALADWLPGVRSGSAPSLSSFAEV